MRIDLQWAFTEEDMEARSCEICEAHFEPRAVIIRVDPHGYEACEACLRALSARKEEEPAAPWPSWEEYTAILEAHPAPMFSSEEEMKAAQPLDDPWWDEWPAVDASWLWKPGEGNAVRIAPTVLYKAEPDAVTAAIVEKAGKGRALLVFRSGAEAEKYRAMTGNNPSAEGWGPVTLGLEDLANVIEMHGCTHVAMPEEWTGGKGGVDFFAAETFLGMLEEAPPA